MISLAYHSELRDGLVKDPGLNKMEYAIQTVVMRMQAAEWRSDIDPVSRENFDYVVKLIDMTSSPGYPYLLRANTNAIFFNYKEGVFDEARLDHIWSLVQAQIRSRRSDPIRLFIKPEPHSVKKLESGRYRLISSVSIIDQIIDAMLFGEMNRKVVQNWLFLPTRVGWSFLNGGWKFISMMTPQMAIDKSSWDWTACGWLFEAALEVRKRLCRNLQTSGAWEELATWRYTQLFHKPVFITSGGLLLKQKEPGVMKSGCYNTLVDNSIMQLLLHALVTSELEIPFGNIITMGDDTLQDDIPEPKRTDYLDRLSRYCIVKTCQTKFEFCGMQFFMGGRLEPMYRGKHAYKMLYMSEDIVHDMATSYSLMYHKSRFGRLIKDFFIRCGCRVPNDNELTHIFG